MSEDDALLAALQADPADRNFRLVYADWLDERGDSRGEWLRSLVLLDQFAVEGRWDLDLANRRRQLEAGIDPAWLAIARLPRRDGMAIRNWHEFYDSLVTSKMYGEVLPRPTAGQLDQFEAEAGFRLPRSYREYIQVFGPGELLGVGWKIPAPYQKPAEHWDLSRFHKAINPSCWVPDHFPEPEHERIRRSFYFCYDYKDAFAWDLAELTDAARPEYSVYHMTSDMTVVRVADSFQGFVEWAVDWMLGFTASEWEEEECGPRMSFCQACDSAGQLLPG